jgi:hypothetical protein
MSAIGRSSHNPKRPTLALSWSSEAGEAALSPPLQKRGKFVFLELGHLIVWLAGEALPKFGL